MFFFEQLYQNYHKRVDAALIQYIDRLPFADSILVAAMRDGALLGGKRLRPYLVYATGQMFGVTLDILDAPAAAVECIHAYSLMHDDLPAMDDDHLRRGQPTTHVKFGEAYAILAGDAFQSLAFSILADSPMPSLSNAYRLTMLSELAQASGVAGMCIGQALDLEAEGKDIDVPVLEQIYNYKTGALIRCAIRMGALASGRHGRNAIPLLDKYAVAIGLAFQVQDDILNVIGDSTKTGKPQGSDRDMRKSTYPALCGLQKAHNKTQSLYKEAIHILAELERCFRINTMSLKSLTSFIIERDT
ncbi:(2E,6E)-farnesyl diphosphate synthase [Candidatus Profftia tarda]|uniref:Farnesyl diphosphate synthase n=1 Tax=Candidatus Profftia tarda TaxID=1177216 RepID=A0A8E4EYT4_9ENTR|nr:(2E,6E)-farnesyl diphosphate synthase [Candidatus Profftia tarda]CAD6512311.1 Farnesyl diphosphate synthase [Candidatus Profftia tarda]